MTYPTELQYAKTHEWLKITGEKTGEIGLTDFAQKELGELVFVNLPEVGDAVTVNEAFADVESVKAVSDVYSPVNAVVSEVNEKLLDEPGLINESPYEAWLIRVRDISETDTLMDKEAYEAFCRKED